LTVGMQIDGGCSAPPPRTSSSSNGGRDLPERGGARLQNSDVFEGERKRERLGSIAAVVCFSTESNGSFYRRGRGRELGFLKGGLVGKIPGAVALAMTLGHGDGSWVMRLLRWRAGVAR
jgi:hypothetical protein